MLSPLESVDTHCCSRTALAAPLKSLEGSLAAEEWQRQLKNLLVSGGRVLFQGVEYVVFDVGSWDFGRPVRYVGTMLLGLPDC